MDESPTSLPLDIHCVTSVVCVSFQGWHVAGDPIPMQPQFGALIEEFAPFLSRISAIAKYSRKLVMNCMTQELGRLYLQWLEKVGGL